MLFTVTHDFDLLISSSKLQSLGNKLWRTKMLEEETVGTGQRFRD